MAWYDNQPRLELELTGLQQERKTINQYFSTRTCLTCGDRSPQLICDLCLQEKSRAYFLLFRHIGDIQSLMKVGSQSGGLYCSLLSGDCDISEDGGDLLLLLGTPRPLLLQSGLPGSLQTAGCLGQRETGARTEGTSGGAH